MALMAAPGQNLKYILIKDGKVIDTMRINTSEYPRSADRAYELWRNHIAGGCEMYIRVGTGKN